MEGRKLLETPRCNLRGMVQETEALSILGKRVLLNPKLNYPNNLNLGLITLATISADEYL